MSPAAAPDFAGNARCERCGRPIDLAWTFCAFCGQDNRPPEHRHDPIAAHTHQLAFGPFCIWCGAQTVRPSVHPLNAAQVPTIGVGQSLPITVSVPSWNPIFGGVELVFAVFVMTTQRTTIWWFLGVPLLVGGLFHLSWVRSTTIDPRTQTVIWQKGFRPWAQPQAEPFSAFNGIGLRTVWHSGSSGTSYNSYSIELRRPNGSRVLMRNRGFRSDSMELGSQLASIMGIPFDEQARGDWFNFF
ncbi:MAG TPA: zinc ribbon domain-containing protein [Fimbriimonas sp.]|nr:zinc ribbon domain-containing protein [Fimbriimonas sp.]